MNILAFYLPQYHQIPENNEWWGNGYTEWDSVKRGKILKEGQYQPRVPLNNNYYDLSNVDVMEWQAGLAKKYGVYGFCVYHYWFNGKKLLEKPMEQLLEHPEIDFPFCFCWANEDWSNIWEGDTSTIRILISNKYDDQLDWIEHFNYMVKFFHDPRYIKEDNKPVLVIYNPLHISTMDKMKKCWENMAIKAGFDGIIFMYQTGRMLMSEDFRKGLFDYGIEYYPGLASIARKGKKRIIFENILHNVATYIRQHTKLKLERKIKENHSSAKCIKEIEDYDDVWNYILHRDPKSEKVIPGAFVDWDNTPRRKYAGKVILGASPEKFKLYMKAMIGKAKNVYKKNIMFIFAWNEWSEGGYLEPDEKYGYQYLEAIRDALLETGTFPKEEDDFQIELKE